MAKYEYEIMGNVVETDTELTDSQIDEIASQQGWAGKKALPKATPPKAAAQIQAELDKKVAPDKKAEDKSVLGFLKNAGSNLARIPGQAYDLVKSLDPVDVFTGKSPLVQGVASLGKGAAKSLTTQNPMFGGQVNPQDKDVQAFMGMMSPVGEAIQNPAGIPAQLGNYAYENPIDAAMNLSMGAGVAAKGAQAANLAKTAGALGKVSAMTDPINLAGKAIGGIAGGTATKMMESALKPSTSAKKMTPAMREQVVQTMLDNGYRISEKSSRTASRDYGRIGQKIDQEIAKAAEAGAMVDVSKALNTVDDVKAFYSNMPDAQNYLDDLDKFRTKMVEQTKAKYGSTMMPIEDANKMKSAIYKIHNNHYNTTMKGVEIDAEKALARGIKDEIAKQFPAIAELNAKSATLKNLDNELKRAVVRARNNGALNWTKLASMGGAAAIGVPAGIGPAMVAAGTAYVMTNPKIKSLLAIIGNKAKYAKGMSREAGMAAQAGYASSKLMEDNNGVQ